jgi:predicted O-linked N-acetylglucosamine transferase (SPINDLY family)
VYQRILRFLLGRHEAAQPDPATIILLAEQAVGENDLELGARLFAKALHIGPGNPMFHYKYGNFLRDQGSLDPAIQSYSRAISLKPGYANAFCNRGVVLQRLNRNDEALADYVQAVALDPQDSLAHYNMGVLLQTMERTGEALENFNRAIAIHPGYVNALCNRGKLFQELGRHAEACADFDLAINVDHGFAHAYFARGTLRQANKELKAALADYTRVIQLNAEHADAHCNLGTVLAELQQYDAAIASLNAAIKINPRLAEAHSNLAHTLLHLKQLSAAIASYDEAIALKPGLEFAAGMRLYAKMQLSDWSDQDADKEAIALGVQSGAAIATPLIVATLFDSPHLGLLAAQTWVRKKCPPGHLLPAIPVNTKNKKIKIGYFSMDFCDHPVSILAAELVGLHDRSRYQVTAFSLGFSPIDPMRKRLEQTFDEFLELREKSDQEIALLSRSMGIDIAIDLAGHTGASRTSIFALRAAPIQITFLGYPGTMAAGYIDYLIADRTVVPVSQQQHYQEKIIYLPDQFMPHDSTRSIASRQYTRDELGLPPRGIVFCCFNSNHKILPEIFDVWMRILAQVDHSVLWLLQNNIAVIHNLQREAQSRGIDASRLIFAGRMPSAAEHLARLRVADLFLDTLPYNAHATALDALWSGLPVLSRIGEGFAGRVAASLLTAVGLPDLVTSTAAEYERLAVQLAENPQQLLDVKLRLARNRSTMPLFDTARFTKNLENAYEQINDRRHAGLPPDHIYVG